MAQGEELTTCLATLAHKACCLGTFSHVRESALLGTLPARAAGSRVTPKKSLVPCLG